MTRTIDKINLNQTELNDSDTTQLEKFKDASEISTWAESAMALALKSGLIEGIDDTHLVPALNVSRAQAAVILKRMLQYAKFIN